MRNIFGLCALVLLLSLSLGAASAQDDPCFAELEVMTTADGVEFVRTPDACFEDLPDWDYEPQYVEIDGLRQAYVDVGTGESGETILLLHGQPSWSYLYRHMIPVLADAGHRVIAMDHVGMGRSDKPIDPDYYTFTGHVARLEAFIQELELEQGNLTAFVQDWGSLIGLQVIGTNPDWFDRVVVGNGFLPVFEEGTVPYELPENPLITRQLFYTNITNMPAQQEPLYDEYGNRAMPMNDFFGIWIDYARNDERFIASQILEAMTYFDLTDEELAAYDAPFPSRIAMGGPRAFPGIVNQLPGITQVAWEGLYAFENPFLTIWGNNDPGNLGQPEIQQTLLDSIPGTAGWDHVRLEEASHFLQDDQGEEIARRVNAFIAQAPTAAVQASPIPTVTQTQFMPLPEDLRDFRYCEVLAITLDDMVAIVDVYNTMGHNDCPADQWSQLDAAAIARTNGLLMARLNGPRYWVIDGIQGRGASLTGDVADFDGMEMRWVARIKAPMATVIAQAPYAPRDVQRDTTFVYNAGGSVYELISPEGDLYRMQAYSQIVDPTLTIADLETLGARLALPEGWRYEARVLDETSELVASGLAVVIQDELQNTYQLVAEPLQ
jgi:haloalkane dehalogenase